MWGLYFKRSHVVGSQICIFWDYRASLAAIWILRKYQKAQSRDSETVPLKEPSGLLWGRDVTTVQIQTGLVLRSLAAASVVEKTPKQIAALQARLQDMSCEMKCNSIAIKWHSSYSMLHKGQNTLSRRLFTYKHTKTQSAPVELHCADCKQRPHFKGSTSGWVHLISSRWCPLNATAWSEMLW